MPVACGLLLSSRPLGTLQWSKGEIRIQSSGSSTQITTTSRCSGEIAKASLCKGKHNQLRNRMARPDRAVRLQVLLKRYSPKCVELEFSEVRIQHFAYPWPHGTRGWTRGAYVVHTSHVASGCVHDLAQRRMGHGPPQAAQVYRQCS